MSELKTKKNNADVRAFLESIEHTRRREDGLVLLEIFNEVTGIEPSMWGESIVGYGDYHYKYKSGREGDWFVVGFSPRKQNLTLYFMCGFDEHKDKLEALGKHKLGKGCLYINKLQDVDLDVLREIIKLNFE